MNLPGEEAEEEKRRPYELLLLREGRRREEKSRLVSFRINSVATEGVFGIVYKEENKEVERVALCTSEENKIMQITRYGSLSSTVNRF